VRLGIPRSTWYYWRRLERAGGSVRRREAPVVEATLPLAKDYAGRYSAWGHRKIWAMMRADGVSVSASSVLRALRRLDLVLPEGYQQERTKCALAAPVTGTGTARDAVAALSAAIQAAEAILGRGLIHDCVDERTGEISPLRVVTDNGSAFKSDAFLRFFRERPYLEHIRTRHYAPQTNGVVERFNQSLKYEHLYQREISQAAELAEEVEAFLHLYSSVRPHEALDFRRPLEIYLEDPHLFWGESVQDA
jgi:putative transposase